MIWKYYIYMYIDVITMIYYDIKKHIYIYNII